MGVTCSGVLSIGAWPHPVTVKVVKVGWTSAILGSVSASNRVDVSPRITISGQRMLAQSAQVSLGVSWINCSPIRGSKW